MNNPFEVGGAIDKMFETGTPVIHKRLAVGCKQCGKLAKLLLEARDALPAISLASARLHGVDLSLADRIEDALEPWRIPDPAAVDEVRVTTSGTMDNLPPAPVPEVKNG